MTHFRCLNAAHPVTQQCQESSIWLLWSSLSKKLPHLGALDTLFFPPVTPYAAIVEFGRAPDTARAPPEEDNGLLLLFDLFRFCALLLLLVMTFSWQVTSLHPLSSETIFLHPLRFVCESVKAVDHRPASISSRSPASSSFTYPKVTLSCVSSSSMTTDEKGQQKR